MYQVNVFVSHSWKYTGHYDKIAEWLFRTGWNVAGTPLRFLDYSIPESNPIPNPQNTLALQSAIYAEMVKSHIIVIPMGMYAQHSTWIQKEIDGARYYRKPILAVNPWGQERKASVVANAADDVVGWSKESVAKGVWGLYRRFYA